MHQLDLLAQSKDDAAQDAYKGVEKVKDLQQTFHCEAHTNKAEGHDDC